MRCNRVRLCVCGAENRVATMYWMNLLKHYRIDRTVGRSSGRSFVKMRICWNLSGEKPRWISCDNDGVWSNYGLNISYCNEVKLLFNLNLQPSSPPHYLYSNYLTWNYANLFLNSLKHPHYTRNSLNFVFSEREELKSESIVLWPLHHHPAIFERRK